MTRTGRRIPPSARMISAMCRSRGSKPRGEQLAYSAVTAPQRSRHPPRGYAFGKKAIPGTAVWRKRQRAISTRSWRRLCRRGKRPQKRQDAQKAQKSPRKAGRTGMRISRSAQRITPCITQTGRVGRQKMRPQALPGRESLRKTRKLRQCWHLRTGRKRLL